MDITKLDMYRGDAASDEYMASPEAQKKVKENDPDEDFGESESESDDEDEADIGKTQEGGLIQALLNIQLQPRIKDLLPNWKQTFNDEIKGDKMDCYAMKMKTPDL